MGRSPRFLSLASLQLGLQALIILPQSVCLFAQLGHLPGLLLLSCLHLLAPEEELVFRGLICWIAGHGGEFRLSNGMFGNGQSFGDREITWERVYPSSLVSHLRFLVRHFPQMAPIIVSGILRVSGSSGHSPVGCNLQNKQEDDGGVPSSLRWQS